MDKPLTVAEIRKLWGGAHAGMFKVAKHIEAVHLLLGEVDRLGAELETAEEACGDAAAEVQRLRTLHEDEEGGA